MVSVIVPTYNYGRYISDCLQSLQKQSYDNWECLVIDNASTDNTAQVCGKFSNDARIKYIKLTENKGPAPARNRGLEQAKGEYILFLDADDLVERDKLKQAVNYLEANPKTDLVYGDMRYFKNDNPGKLYSNYLCSDTNDSPWMSYAEGTGQHMVQQLLGGNIMVISSPIFRAALIKSVGSFDEKIAYNEDWDLWLRIALNKASFKYLDAEFTKALIRSHATSASRDVFKMQMCGLYVLIKNSPLLKTFQVNEQVKARIEDHTKALAASLIKLPAAELMPKLQLLEGMNLDTYVLKLKTKNFFLIKLQLRLHLLF